jgi:TIR domain-containing protein
VGLGRDSLVSGPLGGASGPLGYGGGTGNIHKMWDLFISHAREDKDAVARPLAALLEQAGLRVWFDEQTLRLGDSLRRKIDEGLAHSQFGVVILSPSFFAKEWPARELDGLFAREEDGRKVILPIWHNIDHAGVAARSPALAAKLAVPTMRGLEEVVREIMAVVRPEGEAAPQSLRIRFNDDLYADVVSVKLAVAALLNEERSVEVLWPSPLDALLDQIKSLKHSAETYHERTSRFFGCDSEIVSNFIDTSRTAISTATQIKKNIPNRVVKLVDGMREYWWSSTFLIERALANFLTLANFDAQFGLVYCFRYTVIADLMPPNWLRWFEPDRTSKDRYRELFDIDEDMCSGRVMSVSEVYVNQYVWGPCWMIMEAARSGADQVIANPWFVKFLIPQVELALSWQPDAQTIPYRERAVVTKVVSASGTELY